MATVVFYPVSMSKVSIESKAPSYAGAVAGTSRFSLDYRFLCSAHVPLPPYEQYVNEVNFKQSFLRFDTRSIPYGATVSYVYFNSKVLLSSGTKGTNVNAHNWGASLETSDWYTNPTDPARLFSLPDSAVNQAANAVVPITAVTKAGFTSWVLFPAQLAHGAPAGYLHNEAQYGSISISVTYLSTASYTIRYWLGEIGGRSAGANYTNSANIGVSYSTLVSNAGEIDKYRQISDCDAGSATSGTVQASGGNYIDVVYPLNNQSMFSMF